MKIKSGCTIISGICLVILLSVYVCAQNEPVILEYKFHQGELLQYQIGGDGKGTMQISGVDTSFNIGTTANAAMPITMELLGYIAMSTKQVNADKSAEIELTFDNFVENMNMMNQKIALMISKDKYQMYMNGQQMYSSDSGPSLPFFGKPITYKMSKSGRIEEVSGLDWMKQMMPSLAKSMDFNDLLKQTRPVFPEHPIKIGDSWASTTEFKLSPAKGESAKIVLTSTYTGTEKVNGKMCAVIQYTGKFDLANWKLDLSDTTENNGFSPEINFKNMWQIMTGKSYHALDAGQIVKGEYQQKFGMELSMKMPMPNPKTNQPFEMTTKMDLAMNMVMELKK